VRDAPLDAVPGSGAEDRGRVTWPPRPALSP
jgi:hypothetical protein